VARTKIRRLKKVGGLGTRGKGALRLGKQLKTALPTTRGGRGENNQKGKFECGTYNGGKRYKFSLRGKSGLTPQKKTEEEITRDGEKEREGETDGYGRSVNAGGACSQVPNR